MASVAARLSLADIAHRTLVTGLFGLTCWGGYGIYALHHERLRLGLIAQAEHDAQEAKIAAQLKEDQLLKQGKLQA
ncbi:hypothetical protein T439DRAFT_39179 [Meredithblackwellia eburnea MCA 4105]